LEFIDAAGPAESDQGQEAGRSLLASRPFWIASICSACVMVAICFAIARYL
jgi:hypothetical protein